MDGTYEEYGREVARTDYNSGNRAQGIPNVPHHVYEYGPGYAHGKWNDLPRLGPLRAMNSVIDDYLALHPRDVPYLAHLVLSQEESSDDGVPEVVLELTFRGSGEQCMVVRCRGVRNLVFRQPCTSDMKVHSLDVRDVTSHQLESTRFQDP